MHRHLHTLIAQVRSFFTEEKGQDLVEYALVVALLALAATAGMNKLATDLTSAYTKIGTTLNSDI